MHRPVIYIVVPRGTVVLGAYSSKAAGDLHEQSVTGAEVVAVELHDQAPLEVSEDIYLAEMEDFEEDLTPVDGAVSATESWPSRGDPDR